MANDSVYRYRELDSASSTIRLVTILPGDFASEIVCSLSHVELSTSPEYEALSYVWGDMTQTVRIVLDGFYFQVTTKLERALRFLRNPTSPRVMWVDSICINQGSNAEKSTQVLRMGSIYKAARIVVVWLGEEIEVTDEDPQNHLQRQLPLSGAAFARAEQIAALPAGTWKTQLPDVLSDPSFWDDICKLLVLFKRPWFERIWTLQEAALSRQTIFLCERTTCSMEVLDRATYRLTSVGNPPPLADTTSKQGVMPFTRILFCRMLASQPDLEADIPSRVYVLLSQVICHRKSTDPRDRLYGMLGICAAGDQGELDASIMPDYNKSTADVFLGLAEYLLRQRHSLDILYGDRTEFEDLPSWVPSWGKPAGGAPLSHFIQKTPCRPASIQLLNNGKELQVQGIKLGDIGFVGPRADNPADPESYVASLGTLLQEWERGILDCSFVRNVYATDTEVIDEWEKTIMYDLITIHSQPLSEEERTRRLMSLMMYKRFVGRMQNWDSRMDSVLQEVALDRWKNIEGTYPFATTRGGMGLATGLRSGPRTGDALYLIAGATVPFIIRRVMDKYQLMCPCFFKGSMSNREQEALFEHGRLETVILI